VSGASSVLQAMLVAQLLSAPPARDALPFEAAAACCHAGQGWNWDGVRFDMLHLTRDSYADPSIKDNNRGGVLGIAPAEAAVLMPADTEARTEAALLAAAPGL
jgi:competence protein ComEC